MANAMLEKFAANHGINANEIFHPSSGYGPTERSGYLQNELSHFSRGWDAQQEPTTPESVTAAQAAAIAHEKYDRMISWNASMGAIDRQEYVAGFVAAAGF